MVTAINGFRKTGICPFNPDIFPDHLFAPSLTTDQPMPLDQNSTVPQQNYTAVDSAPVNDPVVPVQFVYYDLSSVTVHTRQCLRALEIHRKHQ